MNRGGVQGGSWSRYIFPFTIEHFAHLENTLYLRHGDIVSYVIEGSTDDDGVGFSGVIQWPWLDFGQPGVNKLLEGFDIVAYGTSAIEIGYDQTNTNSWTASFAIPEDTYPGQVIPLPILSPSMSVRLTFDPDQAWQWNAMSLYLQDMRVSS